MASNGNKIATLNKMTLTSIAPSRATPSHDAASQRSPACAGTDSEKTRRPKRPGTERPKRRIKELDYVRVKRYEHGQLVSENLGCVIGIDQEDGAAKLLILNYGTADSRDITRTVIHSTYDDVTLLEPPIRVAEKAEHRLLGAVAWLLDQIDEIRETVTQGKWDREDPVGPFRITRKCLVYIDDLLPTDTPTVYRRLINRCRSATAELLEDQFSFALEVSGKDQGKKLQGLIKQMEHVCENLRVAILLGRAEKLTEKTWGLIDQYLS